MIHRTRIKLCGLKRLEDVQHAVALGADAVGLVFYPGSPRYLTPPDAASLLAGLPPFVSAVGLFVNATTEQVVDVVRQVPLSVLQFHGDESLEQCCLAAHAVNRPFVRAVRITPGFDGADLLKCEQTYRAASELFAGLLLDAATEGYGGGGKVFDWSVIPAELAPRIILGGGLNPQNVAQAVSRLHPYAVDVSSGIEESRGVKDRARMSAFVEAARKA